MRKITLSAINFCQNSYLSKHFNNANIIKKQIFHKIMPDLKGYVRSNKALVAKFFLAQPIINQFDKNFLKIKYDLKGHIRLLLCYREVGYFFLTFRSFDQMTNYNLDLPPYEQLLSLILCVFNKIKKQIKYLCFGHKYQQYQ